MTKGEIFFNGLPSDDSDEYDSELSAIEVIFKFKSANRYV